MPHPQTAHSPATVHRRPLRSELLVFAVLAIFIWPVVAVGVVGGWGLAVWIYQQVYGPPGPPGARTGSMPTTRRSFLTGGRSSTGARVAITDAVPGPAVHPLPVMRGRLRRTGDPIHAALRRPATADISSRALHRLRRLLHRLSRQALAAVARRWRRAHG